MALSRTAWIAGGLAARLLMVGVLALAVERTTSNDTSQRYDKDFYKLESYSYMVAAAAVGMAGCLLQIPVGVYLLCVSKRVTPSALVLDASMYADVVVTIFLATGVGAGFGATVDALRYVHNLTYWSGGDAMQQDFISYYNRAYVPAASLLAGMLLSMAATIVSARMRARAIDNADVV